MHIVYVLKNSHTLRCYYGYTTNLERRMAQHNHDGSWELIYYEGYKNERDARVREYRLKHSGQAVAALKQRLAGGLR